MARFTLTIPDELNSRLSLEAHRRDDTKNHFICMALGDYLGGADFTLCAKYRAMILNLLRYGEGIPKQVRTEAYELLNKAFEDME
jgi:hypothetical protein